MKNNSKNRARIRILSDVLSFPMIGDSWKYGNAVAGDLVCLQCAPPSKYYLSWLIRIDDNNGWPRYLLESIEDGDLCWWSNVGITYYDRERSKNPYWHWDDKQYNFDDKWRRVFKRMRAYDLCPMEPEFDGNRVTLGIGKRWTDGAVKTKVIEDWKKTKSSEMIEFYNEVEKVSVEQDKEIADLCADGDDD